VRPSPPLPLPCTPAHLTSFVDHKPPRGDALRQAEEQARARAAQRAQNRRFGEAISECGFGGETTARRRSGGEGEGEEERERRERRRMGDGEGEGMGA